MSPNAGIIASKLGPRRGMPGFVPHPSRPFHGFWFSGLTLQAADWGTWVALRLRASSWCVFRERERGKTTLRGCRDVQRFYTAGTVGHDRCIALRDSKASLPSWKGIFGERNGDRRSDVRRKRQWILLGHSASRRPPGKVVATWAGLEIPGHEPCTEPRATFPKPCRQMR